MNSEPLPEWNPLTSKGNWRSIASSAASRYPSLIKGVAAHDLPLRHLIGGVEMVQALAFGGAALVHGVDAQVARNAVRRGLPALADRDLRGPRLLVMEGLVAVLRAGAQVVQLAVRDAGQPLELALAVDLELAFQNVLGRRPAQTLVRPADPRQKGNVLVCIKSV